MRLRKIKNAENILKASKYFIEEPKIFLGSWKSVFKNDNAICIEIGMGKGTFLIEMAKRNPHINYIGIEKFASVLIRASEKLEEESLENLKLICIDANDLREYFADFEVSDIYLNFSDPWPKSKHSKRRLTSTSYLQIYQNIIKQEGMIYFKTDNRLLFEFSIISMNEFGMSFIDICLDLHKTDFHLSNENIMTEYEKKFSIHGPIYRMITSFKK